MTSSSTGVRLPNDMIRLGRQLCLHSTETKEWFQTMEGFRQHYDVDEQLDPNVHARWEGRANRQHLREDFERLKTAMILSRCADDFANEDSIASDSCASTPMPTPSVDHPLLLGPVTMSSDANGQSTVNVPSESPSQFAANSSRRRLPVPGDGIRLRNTSRRRIVLRQSPDYSYTYVPTEIGTLEAVAIVVRGLLDIYMPDSQRPRPPIQNVSNEEWSGKRVTTAQFLMMGRAGLTVLEKRGFWGGGSGSTETSSDPVVDTNTTQTTPSKEVTVGEAHGTGAPPQDLRQLAMSENRSDDPRLREIGGVHHEDADGTSTQTDDSDDKDMEMGNADDMDAPVRSRYLVW
ncbi:hypothetical protein FB567DRAFT_598396 [Paraphoma chrysanthemicola]|uniref:Uncharacterized protein n=1 Tax=Paraphoma chrysanthemicola TaxID=798071 RepID=A0A8K0QU56_9PLEO|nr:hypothetical protein FB567DRAFT_598396 [Paraphoma chrysanthemicola]